MRRVAIFLAIALILSALGYGGWTVWKKFQAPPVLVKVESAARVERRNVSKYLILRGEVQAPISSPVKSEVSGRVAHVLVSPGDVVKKGEKLLELNQEDIRSQIDQEAKQIEASQLKSERIRVDFDREQQLLDRHLVPQKDYDDMKVDYELGKNELGIEKDKLNNLKDNLAKATIVAPHDGTILNVKVADGGVITGAGSVSEGTTLMTLADLSHLDISSEVNEIVVTKLTLGMPAEITFDALPDLTLQGTISFISPSAEEKVDQKSIRVFSLIVSVNKPDPRIRVGLSANIKIAIEHVDHALTLPLTTVFQQDDKSYVFLGDHGIYSKHDVVTGINDGKIIEIKEGLKEKDSVSMRSSTPMAPQNPSSEDAGS